MSRDNEKYNGWTNYATWRVHLEVFDGMEWDSPVEPYDLRDMAEEIVDAGAEPDSTARDWAFAFLEEVDWYEIAKHINEPQD